MLGRRIWPRRRRLTLSLGAGRLADGTGAAAIEADVAVSGGKIAAVGTVSGSGAEEIDARGKLVTPGFVDIHTHYDGQAAWDSHLAPSAWHGVTTAVMGNCGVGFAPCRPEDRDKLVELMEGVEDIPGPVMHEGLKWEWRALTAISARWSGRTGTWISARFCPMRPCGSTSWANARSGMAATPEDIARMRVITADAIRAGAFGFSTSRTISHKSLDGTFTPTLRAHEDELLGIAMGMADAGAGFLETVSDWDQPDPETEFAMLRRVIEACGRTAVFSLTQRHDRPHFWQDLLRLAGEAAEDGLSIRPVVAPRPIGILLGLEGSQNPFSGTPTYKTIASLPLEERVAAMRTPEVRADPRRGPGGGGDVAADPPDHVFEDVPLRLAAQLCPRRDGLDRGRWPRARAGRRRRWPTTSCWRMKGRGFIYTPLVNYASYDFSASEAMLADKTAIMGLGDGGAHVGFILDAGYPTWLLSYWAKERGRFPVEEAVRRLTTDTASAAGLSDRGRIAERG